MRIVAQKRRIAADISGMAHFRTAVAHARRPLAEPSGASPSQHYAAVCAVLWSERELLESLACTVIVEQLMSHAHAGAARQAANTVQHTAMRRLALQEVLRAAIVEALTTATSASRTATLCELAAEAPEPWRTMMLEHRDALHTLAGDLGSLGGFDQLSLNEFLA